MHEKWLDSVSEDVELADGVLYSRAGLAERNLTFEVAEYAPGFLLIGQGGAGGFLIPVGQDGPVYRVDLGSMAPDDFEVVAESFGGWWRAGFPVPEQGGAISSGEGWPSR
jgi:hypothetical protein